MPSIVTVNVNQIQAPAPSTLQSSGALISQGGTNTAAQTLTLLTSLADLTAILKGALAITTLAWASSVVTVTTTAPHGFTIADTLPITIAGASPSGYNGTFTATVTGASAFTYPLVSSPGSMTVAGTYTPEDVSELLAMATTFFAQGSQQAVYVLELGGGAGTEGAADLTTWLNANPGVLYSYLVPRYWDANAAFLALIASYENTTALTYFWVTSTQANYTSYTTLMKCVNVLIEAPSGVPSIEFSQAAPFWVSLHYRPSNTNRVAPFAFSYVFGVTPYPTRGNQSFLTTLKTAGVNVIGTGAEGGISNTIELWGTMKDKRDFTYWYSIDWMNINGHLNIANEVINGSNNPINPLYYNQQGINRLQQRLASTAASAVSYGLALGNVIQVSLDGPAFQEALDAGDFAGNVVVNAVPFTAYARVNPSDYANGIYNGLSVTYTPARGFIAITINITATDFVA